MDRLTVEGPAAAAYLGALMKHGGDGVDIAAISRDARKANADPARLSRLRIAASGVRRRRLTPAWLAPRLKRRSRHGRRVLMTFRNGGKLKPRRVRPL